jgi:catechol 2,3-dioxygenase-like lactoylglutathione lyase family enzyme
MFSHVMIGANDLAASKKFYDAVLGAIGLPAGQRIAGDRTAAKYLQTRRLRTYD